jgi:hypothetical protein
MDLFQIVTAINNTGFTNKQLDEISDAVRYARASLGHHVARTLKPGVQVKFTSSKNGKVYQGTVDSIKIKNAIVTTSLGRYRVPMNMLEVV